MFLTWISWKCVKKLTSCGLFDGSGCLWWSGSKLLKPAKNKFTWSDLTNFSMQISAFSHGYRFRSFHSLDIKNLSNCCRHLYDQSISRYLADFCNFVPLCMVEADLELWLFKTWFDELLWIEVLRTTTIGSMFSSSDNISWLLLNTLLDILKK